MSKRVDLGDGMWMDLRDSVTFQDQQTIYRACKVLDKPSGAFYNDELEGAAVMVDLFVDEWAVGITVEPTSSNFKAMPAKLASRIMVALKSHVECHVGNDEDFNDASAN